MSGHRTELVNIYAGKGAGAMLSPDQFACSAVEMAPGALVLTDAVRYPVGGPPAAVTLRLAFPWHSIGMVEVIHEDKGWL